MKKIYFFRNYLQKRFGYPLYRIPIDLPLSCPHRRKDAGRGCIFCSDTGARARHLRQNLNLAQQVEAGIQYVRKRYGVNNGYIAYFQSFTNTDADVATLRKYYSEVLNLAEFEMVIIATRPDCLPEDVLDYLRELADRYDLWIELGVQSANDSTLKRINRGHDFACVENAVNKLKSKNIKSAAHVILGLPGENTDDYKNTAKKLSVLPFSGIKIHNLLVLKNTPLAKMYADGQIKTMNEYEYARDLVNFLLYIPDDWPVMRLCTDAAPEEVIAPKWWMKKGQFITYVEKIMDNPEGNILSKSSGDAVKVETGDGSYTVYHPEYRQHFHSIAGAKSESLEKFIGPSRIEEYLRKRDVKLLDVGFGLGYNTFSSIEVAERLKKGKLRIVALENDPRTLDVALKLFTPETLDANILRYLLKDKTWKNGYAEAEIIFKDARESVRTENVMKSSPFDVILLDPFSPDKNPELWTYDFFRQLKKLLSEDGTIITYSSAYPVIGAFLRCGFHVGKTTPFGRKRPGLIVARNSRKIDVQLSEKELGIVLSSTAGAVYRDPKGSASRNDIFKRRKKLISRLRGKGVPKWYTG